MLLTLTPAALIWTVPGGDALTSSIPVFLPLMQANTPLYMRNCALLI